MYNATYGEMFALFQRFTKKLWVLHGKYLSTKEFLIKFPATQWFVENFWEAAVSIQV